MFRRGDRNMHQKFQSFSAERRKIFMWKTQTCFGDDFFFDEDFPPEFLHIVDVFLVRFAALFARVRRPFMIGMRIVHTPNFFLEQEPADVHSLGRRTSFPPVRRIFRSYTPKIFHRVYSIARARACLYF